MHKKIALSCFLILLAVQFGCQTTRPALVKPPGSMQAQQQKAPVYDPFATTDAGPEMVGVRPREFEKPLAEPVRAAAGNNGASAGLLPKNYDAQVRSRGFRDTRWPF